jgi:hypothetical protein
MLSGRILEIGSGGSRAGREGEMAGCRVVFAAVVAVGLLSVPTSAAADWTVLVYLDGDNSLSSYSTDDVNEMCANFNESLGYEIICLWDRSSNNDTRRIRIRNGSYQTLSSGFEADMGNWTTLRDFVNWGTSSYPADKYFVVCWDHGDGWYKPGLQVCPLYKGFCSDDATGHTIGIADGDFLNALQGLDEHIDVWGFDCCLMGMIEVMAEAQGYVDYFVGSENTEPGDGWPYDTIVSWLNSVGGNPTPALFAEYVARRYVSSYGASAEATQAAVDLGASFQTLLDEVDEFAKNLGAYGGKTVNPLPNCWNNTQDYEYYGYYYDHKDLYDFADEVSGASKAPSVPLEISSQAVMDAVDDAVIWSGYTGSGMSGSNGIAIYYPYPGSPPSSYDNLRFAQESFWFNYVDGATTPVELAAFEASPTDEGVLLTWQTQSEQDNLGFMLYRSPDGAAHRTAVTDEPIAGAGTTALPTSYEYVDAVTEPGRYLYWLQDVSAAGPGEFYGPAVATIAPAALALRGPSPNPVSQDVELTLSVPSGGRVELSLYDATGRLVETVVDENLQEGAVRRVSWTAGEKVTPGRYVWSLRANGSEATQPMVIVK